MVGWLVFGTLGATLAAELYVMYKNESKKEQKCKCSCGCCCKEKEEEIEVVDSLDNKDEQ